MTSNPKIGLIGSGAMGEAIIAGLLRNQVTDPASITASGPRPERASDLSTHFGIVSTTNNLEAVHQADVVILSVKPQKLEKVLAGIRGEIPVAAVVLSIVAGASLEMLSQGLSHPSVVRAMPNTPAQIGQGITVWIGSSAVKPEQFDLVRQILSALGSEIQVEEENYLDMATALSGTGPAYVFMFLEALIDSGVHLGFPRRIAEQLVVQTLRGSVEYYANQKLHPAALRNLVTSPGGTSAAALYYLEKAGFRTAISRAIWAAYERSQELGKDRQGRDPERKGNND
jgi:pyrroline-5-carboxylate reductase